MKNKIYEACLARKESASPGEPFWNELAEEFGYPNGENLRSHFRRESKKRGDSGTKEETSTYKEIHNKEIHIVYANTKITTPEEVIEHYNIDTSKWKIEHFQIKQSMGYRKDRKVDWEVENGTVVRGNVKDSGKMLVVPLNNIHVKFIPITSENVSFEDIQKFYRDRNFVCDKKFPKHIPCNERVLEICETDMHLGAPSHDGTKVEDMYLAMMSDIFHRLEHDTLGFTKIIFVPFGDIFHYDTEKKQTTYNQTVVEGNGISFLEMFDKAIQLKVKVIEKLLEYAPVEVVYIPGNHDANALYHLLCVLSAYFKDEEGFSVDLEHKSRKWRVVGKNLFGLHHGEMPKKNQVHWLQIEARKEWAHSLYVESHAGHWHHEEVSEHGGIKNRTLPAITPTDNWHYRIGYIGNIRATMCFVWEEDRVGWSDMWQCTGI